ncbi:MAG: FtsX-like permease family protein [Acidobacteria bacterium]|nr:FtsX-like permease family protein [Acidobacteriota bacterium]
MSPLDAFRIALRAIFANRLRSALTSLGLIIGVSSVIVLIAVGQGTQRGVTDQIRGLGTDLIFIESSAEATTSQTGALAGLEQSTLVQGDAAAIAADGIPGVVAVAARVAVDAQAVAGANNVGAQIVSTSSGYAEVRDLAIRSGSFITPLHDEDGALVAVLGARVADTLYEGLDPVGQEVRLSFVGGRITLGFVVIGVLEEQGGASEANDQVFVPLSGTADRLRFLYTPAGDLRVTQIDVQTASGADEQRIKEDVTELLLLLHETPEPDFVIQSQDDLISAATEVSNTLSILLGSIAGISLLVGGIGVMNIMLVSVTERTREIGIRRAVGATAGDIVKQFVTEALTLSLFGGIVGVAIGIGASFALDGRELGGQEMTTLIQPWSIAMAFLVAAGVGFASGSYPAYRATTVDPIAALRNE